MSQLRSIWGRIVIFETYELNISIATSDISVLACLSMSLSISLEINESQAGMLLDINIQVCSSPLHETIGPLAHGPKLGGGPGTGPQGAAHMLDPSLAPGVRRPGRGPGNWAPELGNQNYLERFRMEVFKMVLFGILLNVSVRKCSKWSCP